VTGSVHDLASLVAALVVTVGGSAYLAVAWRQRRTGHR